MKKSRIYIELGIILVIVAVLYKSTLLWLYERYMAADSYYSHGFLIPFVTGYLIWMKKDELAKLPRNFSWWGLAIAVFALLLHMASTIAEVFFMSGFSLFFLVFGISLFLYGAAITKKILFPLSFLVFMFPLPLVVINDVSFQLKMVVTKAAVFVLKEYARLPIVNEGFNIYFPRASLTVGNPCSGLRSLISMLALGSIFAYMLKANAFKRIALFALAVPIALFSNFVRVIMLCVAAFVYGNQATKGFFHDFTGYMVFVIAFGGLWVCCRWLGGASRE